MKKTTLLLAAAWMLLLWFVPQSAKAELDVAGNLTKPFTIETTTTSSGGEIEFRKCDENSNGTNTTINLEYRISTDGGESWGDWIYVTKPDNTDYQLTTLNLHKKITLAANTTYKIQLRGDNPDGFSKSTSDYYRILIGSQSTSWCVTLSGNVMSLVAGYDTDNEPAAQAALVAADEIKSNYCFYHLLSYQIMSPSSRATITQLPPRINAENLIFPATYLTSWCYAYLFYTPSELTINSQTYTLSNFSLGVNEGPCFLAPNFNDKNGSEVRGALRNAFMQCGSLNSAHFNFSVTPSITSDIYNDNLYYWVYSTKENKTLYAPASFTSGTSYKDGSNNTHYVFKCASIGQNCWYYGDWDTVTAWSNDAGGGDEPGGGGGESITTATVNVYQAGTTDTTKILYDLPANAVDLGVGVAWATTDYDASTPSKFAAENKGNTGLTASGSSISPNVWYLYSDVSAPTDWRFPTRTECEKAFANGTSRNNLGTNNYRMRIESGISDEYIEIGAHGYVLYSNDWYYGTSYSWQMMNFPYVWISQNECFSLNSSTIEPEFVGCDATCMMTPRLVYDPTSFTTHTLTIHCGDKTYTYKCEHGQEVTVTAVPDEMQEFKWWSDNHTNTNATRTFTVDQDMEVKAVFKLDSSIPQHTATFRNWDGTELYQVDVAVGAMPVYSGSTPTKTDWFFNGWSPAISVMGDADVVYTATFRDLESAPANVNIYQGATADTTKILHSLDSVTVGGITYKPIDLGYGVAWADKNIGASSETAIGNYYKWGDNVANPSTSNLPYAWRTIINSGGTLPSNYDIATSLLGSTWRYPTKTEFEQLISKTTITNNTRFTNQGDNEKYIILPAGGNKLGNSKYDADYQYYWSSTNYQHQRSGYSYNYLTYCLVRTNTNSYKVDFNDYNNGTTIKAHWNLPIRAIYQPTYTTYTLTINVGSYSYLYICQSGQEVTVTANANEGYEFDEWKLENGNTDATDTHLATRTFTITGNITRTATFKEVPTGSTVSIVADNTGYGSVDVATINNVPDDSPITVNSNTLTINNTTVTATVTESNTAQYTYTFTGWTDDKGKDLPESVTADLAIRANFTQTLNTYTVTWKNGEDVIETDTDVPYGETPSYDGETPTKDEDAENTYTFDAWSPAITTVAGNATYTATFTATPNPVEPAELHIVLEEAKDDDYYDDFATRYGGKTANTVTLNRQFEQGRWSTLCLPFEVSGGMMTTLKMSGRVYEFKYATGNANVGEGVNLYFSNAKKIEAGKGYIVNANATLAEKTSFVFSNVKIDVTADSVKPLNSATAYNKLPGYKSEGTIELVGTLRNGTLKGTESGNTYMGLKSNKIYYPNISQGSTIWAYRGIFRSSKALDIKNMQKMRIIVDGEDMGELFIDEDGEILDASGNAESRKFIENGVLYIEREGVVYDAQGKRVESSF